MKLVSLLLIALLNLTNPALSREWIDVSDMADVRLLRNRYRHSNSLGDQVRAYSGDNAFKEDPLKDSPSKVNPSNENPSKDITLSGSRATDSPLANSSPADDHQFGDSIIDFIPKNPFPSTDACLDRSDDPNGPESPEEERRANQLDCIWEHLKKNTNIEDIEKNVEQNIQANIKENAKENAKENTENKETGQKSASSSPRPDQIKKYEVDSKMLSSCLAKNKQLTEDLVCFRNLKSLYSRHFFKMRTVITTMKERDQMIQIHPYSPEFHILVQTMSHENCLTVVDELEKVITKLDQFLSRIEPADWSKEAIYGGISTSILFCFYYIYRYMKLKCLVFTLLCFIVYAHEYYYLLLAKKAEMAHNLHRHQINCREIGMFASIWNLFFRGIQSTVSFKDDECDRLNEHYLYMDAAFKINPMEPVFTIVPKLFSKSVVILLEHSAVALSKFCAQLPFFHAYPILILFLALLVSLVYLLISWHVKLRTAEHDREIRLRQLASGLIVGESRSRLTAFEQTSIGLGSLLDQPGTNDNRRLDSSERLDNRLEYTNRRQENNSLFEDSNRLKGNQLKDSNRLGGENRKEDGARKRLSRFSALDRRVQTSIRWEGDCLASTLRRAKSLDFIPIF